MKNNKIEDFNYEQFINLIPNPILLINNLNNIMFVNFAAELVFGESSKICGN